MKKSGEMTEEEVNDKINAITKYIIGYQGHIDSDSGLKIAELEFSIHNTIKIVKALKETSNSANRLSKIIVYLNYILVLLTLALVAIGVITIF